MNKDTEKKKAKGNCFHCGKPGHWKRNYSHYLASLKNDKPTEGMPNLLVIETNLMDGPFDSWCVDSGTISHICNMLQGFKETRRLNEGGGDPKDGDWCNCCNHCHWNLLFRIIF